MGNLYWPLFLHYVATNAKGGRIQALENGLQTAWINSALAINNATWPTSPISSEEDLRKRLKAAADDAHAHSLPWFLYLYEPEVAVSPERTVEIASEYGLAKFLSVAVMTADDATRLAPPKRPAPAGLTFRRVASETEARVVMNLNMRAYGMPEEITDSVLATQAYYSDLGREFGYVAYLDSTPVSTTTVIEIDGCLYVALVATDPAHHKRGYADAVMRHALAESSAALGIKKTALDATAMGAPVYAAMGYRHMGGSWTAFTVAH